MPDYDTVDIGGGYTGSTAALSGLEPTEKAGRASGATPSEAGGTAVVGSLAPEEALLAAQPSIGIVVRGSFRKCGCVHV